MSRSSEPERTQHTVAELIARYGEAPSTGRRRRRVQDDAHTAPQSIIERVRTDSAPIPMGDRPHSGPGVDRDLADRGPARAEADGRGPGPAGLDSRDWLGLTGYPDFGNPPGRTSHSDLTSPPDLGGGWGTADGRGPGPAAFDNRGGLHEDTWMDLPPLGADPPPISDRTLSGEPITEQLPRLDPVSRDGGPPDPALLDPELRVEPELRAGYRPHSGEPPAGLDLSTTVMPQQAPGPQPGSEDPYLAEAGRSDADPAPSRDETGRLDRRRSQPAADLPPDPEGDIDLEETHSPVREWVVMATQISVGVVGGAVLWLISEWLWQRIPVLALVVALAVITGLVWVVRRVRRAEDLQTTVIAVLVGLFVTVSPAALLLVGR